MEAKGITQVLVFLFFVINCYQGQAQTREICHPGTVPSGWVVIDTETCNGNDCCGAKGKYEVGRKMIIQKIANEPIGTQVVICPGETIRNSYPLPSGWVKVDVLRFKKECCGFTLGLKDNPRVGLQKWVIERID
ncbi:hypothetical protein [Allomuricauda sp. SCSIO 65647]|uniref:hypothetical protein n=1 Tax=Allomuricauda sp. SCSIO 65647 TaxID=2908843 RepID=UPI001F368580|nr:hypothetical protein [Muricauda sp. SCSIO 65647]UJH67376.1 hypothetical protein L0P89_15675 [Muricauda sp. SCSIO 65647]